jgi:hypothetical protein
VSRYRGKVSAWHVAHRLGEHEILGLTEDEQIRLLVRLLQEARKLDPETPLVVDLDRPWAEWMSAGRFQLGPLHLADTLARADLGLAGLGLEIAPGWKPFGSHLRDAFDLSRLLDLYSLVNLPLYLSITIPSSLAEDDAATDGATVDPEQWPADWNAEGQRDLGANWLSLAVAKPFVRSVVWSVATDAHPGPFPHGGLVTRAGAEKPLLDWMRGFRKTFLA